MLFLCLWFGLSAFVILTNIVQWIIDGCDVHSEKGVVDYYYTNGLMLDCLVSVPFGPFVFFLRWAQGNLLPHKTQKRY